MLQNARGAVLKDLGALVQLIQPVARIVLENLRIAEVDLKPALAPDKGMAMSDELVVLD